jgi:hypothetical protein
MARRISKGDERGNGCSRARELGGAPSRLPAYVHVQNEHVSFPHREMKAETVARLDRSKIYVVYCDGIGRLDFAPRNCSAASIGGAATGVQ